MTLRSTFIRVLGLAWALAAPGLSYAQTTEECYSRLTRVLGFESRATLRISTNTRINLGFAERIYRLAFQAGDWQEAACRSTTTRVRRALYQFIKRRWEILLREGQLTDLRHELALLRPLHTAAAAAQAFSEVLPMNLEERYLEALRTKLNSDLSHSPWANYTAVEFDFAQWGEEWRAALGTTAVAAVDLSRRRVALDPFALPPEELGYFLFHEIAHLVHGELTPLEPTDLRASELYAWARTVEFIDWREAQGISIPEEIQRIRRLIQGLGLPRWTEAVLRARGLL